MKKTVIILCIIVSAFALMFCVTDFVCNLTDEKKLTENQSQTVSANASDASCTAAVTDPQSEKAQVQETNIILVPTCPVQSYDGWESWNFVSCYKQIEINGRLYSAEPNYSVFVGKDNLGDVLYEFRCCNEHYVRDGKEYFTVIVREIKNQDKGTAIAVGRKDGLQDGYFAFFNVEKFACDTLGELAYSLNLEKSFTMQDAYSPGKAEIIHYKRNFIEQTVLKFTGEYEDVGYENYYGFFDGRENIIEKEFINLLMNNSNSKHDAQYALANPYHNEEKEYLVFDGWISGYPLEIWLTAQGYMFLDFGCEEKCYYIGQEQYRDFLYNVKSIEELEITPTGEDTQKSNEFESILQKAASLGDIVFWAEMKADPRVYENFGTDCWAYYKKDGEKDVEYSTTIDVAGYLNRLIIINSDKPAEQRAGTTGEGLYFDAHFKGIDSEIKLCNDGFLYITCGEVYRGFNIGMEQYKDFMNKFEKSSLEYTPENPVTLA